ncbi:1,2-dihydroxy-3-keto-5-methylthiopentene dioxygenase-like [Tribolium madens]|uniref:1,2-dihydroxy-3-keto-5-methylthiopentene dioxygenase-like n=1 Tax=Tribolium madens TaxID=41895 RepID=UPI001CF734CA|nr:1,2-dihydroxy-3-keto-5-methylthiopentene dioxygenase-like [Tribolium madens]
MVRAWYMDADPSDQRTPHLKNPPEFLTLDELYKVSGVEYFKLNINSYTTDGVLDKIKKNRGYTYEDEMTCSRECLANFDQMLKKFFQEHLHTDEEIRFVLDGSGFFDVRDKNDNWIRIEVVAGDMIIIPSGIYHRFTLDTKDYIKAKRFFIGEPVWLPHNRPADDMECRKEYLKKLQTGEFKSG